MSSLLRTTLIITTGVILSACASGPKLDEQNLSNVSLAGDWLIDRAASDAPPDLSQRPNRPVGASDRVTLRTLRQASGGLAFVAHDFQVLSAISMLIEQNPDSMGVRYNPGVYRDVTWGKRQRGLWEVDAGWLEQDLLILSDTQDIKVRERFTLLNRDTLAVQIDIATQGQEYVFRRVFNRRD